MNGNKHYNNPNYINDTEIIVIFHSDNFRRIKSTISIR